ncbi:MAG: 50S ribosomal protein L9 [bacterium]
MSIKVLLLADVKDLGSEGDVVSVVPGHARNYLFPRKLATEVTADTMKRVEKIKRTKEAARLAETDAARKVAEKMSGSSLTIPVKAGETDKLFGSVTDAEIASALCGQGFKVDKSQVELEKPIKELGVYEVPIRIHADVSATVKVWVVEE